MLAAAISIRRVAALNRDYEANFRSYVDCLPIFSPSRNDFPKRLLSRPSRHTSSAFNYHFPLLIETERHPLASMATVFAEMAKLPRILNLSNVTMKLVTKSVRRHMVTLPSGLTFMLTPGSHVHVTVFKCYPTESGQQKSAFHSKSLYL